MERSKSKVACGFAFQLLLYALYVFTGIAVVALGALRPAEGGPSELCLINIKVYAWYVRDWCGGDSCGRSTHALTISNGRLADPPSIPPTPKPQTSLGILAALRSCVKLCASFHKYLRRQPTFPTVRELWVRVAIKALVAAHGLILFGVFRRDGELLALQRTGYSLWCFYGVTLWPNLISVLLVPFNFRASLQTARRIQEEQEAEAGTRPLSTQRSLPPPRHHHHHAAQGNAGQYANFAQRTISSGYHVESPEDFRRGGSGGGAQRGSEQSAGEEDQESELGGGGDPYAAAARFA